MSVSTLHPPFSVFKWHPEIDLISGVVLAFQETGLRCRGAEGLGRPPTRVPGPHLQRGVENRAVMRLMVKRDGATLPRPGLGQTAATANGPGDGVVVWQGGRGE